MISLALVLSSGCAKWYGYKYAEIPTIESPIKPEKPAIKSVVIEKEKQYYVSYSIADSMKLYEWLARTEAYEDKLLYRIDIMNKLIQNRK
jgi:hypothetical protein